MKSDREFLDGVYAKAEELTTSSVLDLELKYKEIYQPMNNKKTTRYVKYTGMAAGFLLLVSSAVYLNNFAQKSNQIGNTPVPRDIRMVNYFEQLIEQASDIIAVEASDIDGEVVLIITEDFKNSGNDIQRINIVDNNVIGLMEGQSAIVFINADTKDASVMDVFLRDKDNKDSSIYENQYGETITLEALYNLD